ncbi:glycine--tRNA ligase subunit beta [Candidatus Margulisiibacteriota bacterium]
MLNGRSRCPGISKKEYLDLPKDVLVTTMKKHQKYFSVLNSAGDLLPNFISITNGVKKENLKHVREGNEKVLTARLADAQFFFKEDRKKQLDDLVPELKKVAFYEKLGTIYDKVERIIELSSWIAKELKLTDRQKDNIKEIARLCKADLLTQMVYELPMLQGIMGREYSLLENRSKDIANGISEHYLPRHADDKLPSSIEGAVVGIADKIDSIAGCFSIGLIPTGSADPYALRRQAHGIVSIVLNRKINLALDLLVDKACKLYGPLFSREKVQHGDAQKVIPETLSFIATRVKTLLLDKKIRYDVADSVLSNFEDVLDACEKAEAVSKSLKEEWLKGIVFTADRVQRLAVKATRDNVIEEDFVSDDERKLHELYLNVNNEVGQALEKDDDEKALKELARMTKPVDDFFVKVMVMDKDEKIKANRLALLKTLERMYLEVADFPKIVM